MIRLHNKFHLGDCIWLAHWIRRLFAVEPSLHVELRIHSQYHGEIHSFLDDFRGVTIHSIDEIPHDSVDTWIGPAIASIPRPRDYPMCYVEFFSRLSRRLGLPQVVYEPQDMLIDHPKLLQDNAYCQHWDFLIVNSTPLSGQFDHSADQFDQIVLQLGGRHRLITTRQVAGVPCTLDRGLNLLQIGAVSLSASRIIGIHTSPLICCLNIHTCNKPIWVLDQLNGMASYQNCQLFGDLQELEQQLNAIC